jgi:hypothetical protein
MIARRRLLSTTLPAAAAVPAPAAAQPSLPADPDGTIPAALVAGGAGGRIEPGFPAGHLAVSWSGAASGGTVRFRTVTGWGPWQPVAAGCTAGVDRDDGRGRALLPAGALGVELDPEPGADVRTLAINTTDGPRRTAARRAVPTDPPPGVRDRARYRAGWDAIAGHRDRPSTECPGNACQPALPELRREVVALLRPVPLVEG